MIHEFCPECGTGLGKHFRVGETPGKCCRKYARKAVLEEAIEAVDDAGGDNTEYHKDAIRKLEIE